VKEDKLLALWHDAATNTRVKGTRWGGYQAVVEYLDHFAAAPNPVVRAERAMAVEVGPVERSLGDFDPDTWAWEVEPVGWLDHPIPTRGRLGLWNPDLP